MHLWDTHVGDPTEKLPLTRADKIAFARATLAAGSQAVQVPAGKAQAARHEIGKWLNEGQLREINRQALAELCAGFDLLERAVQVPGWRPIDSAPFVEVHRDGANVYGEYVLGWHRGALRPYRMRWWEVDGGSASNFLADGGYAVFPSDWQPLPPPPLQPLAGGDVR